MPELPDGVSLLLAAFGALGLASAAGFRAFVPPLVFALACRTGHAVPAEGLGWLQATPTLAGLGLAVFAEFVLARRGAGRRPRLLLSVLCGALTATAALGVATPLTRLLLGTLAGGAVAFAVARPSGSARGQALGETLAAALVAVMSVYAPITVPVVVLAMVAGSLHGRRRAGQGRARA